jgi:hypothetical protein
MMQNDESQHENKPQQPARGFVLLRAGALACAILLLILGLSYRHSVQSRIPPASSPDDAKVPAYSRTAPTGPLPVTVPASQFDDPDAQKAYAAAGKIKTVLAQLPCYCYCDRTNGHKHLLDCFRSYHAAGCLTCQREAIFAYQQVQKGKTIAQIRQAIIDGEWRAPSK